MDSKCFNKKYYSKNKLGLNYNALSVYFIKIFVLFSKLKLIKMHQNCTTMLKN